MTPTRARWRRPLARWLRAYGPRRLACELGVDRTVPYRWISGRAAPRARYARAMMRISAGRLTWTQIYGHPEVEQGRQSPAI